MNVAELDRRRRELGMSMSALSRRSGVSMSTIRRTLRNGRNATLANLEAIANALGMDIRLTQRTSGVSLLKRAAKAKADRLVRQVQATSALEGQGVDRKTYASMIEKTVHELLSGTKRRIWNR